LVAHLKLNKVFFAIVFLWLIVGAFLGPTYLAFIPLTTLLFIRRNYLLEMLLGFWFILILSDSSVYSLEFAKTIKPLFILLVALGFFIKRKSIIEVGNPIVKSFLPFIFWSFVVIIFSPGIGVCFQKTLSYALLLFLVPYLVNWSMKFERDNFLRSVVYFGAIILLACLVYSFFAGEKAFLEERFRGFFGNTNGLGIFCMLLFIFFEVALSKDKLVFSKTEKWIFYIVILGVLAYSQTRSAIFSVFIYLLFSRIYFISGFIGFLLFCSIIFLYDHIFELIISGIEILGLDNYFRKDTLLEGSGRVIAWGFAWQEIQSSYSSFTFGKGFNYTETLFKDNFHLLSRRGHLGNAHQSFLTFWLDTGVIGVILYCVGLVITFIKASKKSVLAWPIFYALIFSVSFESWLTASLNPFTIILIMTLTVMIYEEPKEEISEA